MKRYGSHSSQDPMERMRAAMRAAEAIKLPDKMPGLRSDPRPRIGPRIGGWRKQIKPPWAARKEE
jgi:hypothetical protein